MGLLLDFLARPHPLWRGVDIADDRLAALSDVTPSLGCASEATENASYPSFTPDAWALSRAAQQFLQRPCPLGVAERCFQDDQRSGRRPTAPRSGWVRHPCRSSRRPELHPARSPRSNKAFAAASCAIGGTTISTGFLSISTVTTPLIRATSLSMASKARSRANIRTSMLQLAQLDGLRLDRSATRIAA